MFNRVNTYLKKLPYLRSLLGLNVAASSDGLCAIRVSENEVTLLYTTNTTGKTDLSLYKTFTFEKKLGFSAQLSQLVKQYNLEGASCSWILDYDQFQYILLEDLPVEPSEFQDAIRWKIKGILTFPIQDAVIDSFQLPIQKSFRAQKMIMAVVARLSFLQPIIDQIQLSNLNINSIEIPLIALKNIAAGLGSNEASTVLIYLQKKQLDLLITFEKTLYLFRQIDFDSDAQINEESHAVEKLALEIQRSFDYYQSQWRIKTPFSILFFAYKSTANPIAEVLSTYLAMPVKLLDLSSLLTNTAELTIEQQNRVLPMIGSLLREGIDEHATAN